MNSDEAEEETHQERQSVTEDAQKLATLMRMRRQFDDRANKMRMDLLSMKKTASQSNFDGKKDDENQ